MVLEFSIISLGEGLNLTVIEWSVAKCNCRDVGFRRGWQCYESHIREVTLRGRPYKDLGSPTLIASFWNVVLPMTYAHNKLCFHWESVNRKGLPAKSSDRWRVLTSEGANRDRVKRCWVKCRKVPLSGRRLSKGWQCYESNIEGDHLEREALSYKDLAPTPIASFWGVVLLMTYSRYIITICFK